MTFVKIHGEILDSSIWGEGHATRIVWIAMLAMADLDGIVQASVGGLARRAVVTREECDAALSVLLSPDPDSRDGTTGERLEKVPGGWLVLNHMHYRDKRTPQQIATAKRVAAHRARARGDVTGNDVTAGNGLPPPDTETDPESEPDPKPDTHTHPVSASGEIPPAWVGNSPKPGGVEIANPVRERLREALQYHESLAPPAGCRRLMVPASFEEEHVGPLEEILEELATMRARVDAGAVPKKIWRGTMLLTPNGYARMVGENAEWRAGAGGSAGSVEERRRKLLEEHQQETTDA